MKNIIAALLLMLAPAAARAADRAAEELPKVSADISVDPRVELVSAIYRLAGAREYTYPVLYNQKVTLPRLSFHA